LNVPQLGAFKVALAAMEASNVVKELEHAIRGAFPLPQPPIQTQAPVQTQLPVKKSRRIQINLRGWKPLRRKEVEETQVEPEPTQVEPEPMRIERPPLRKEDAQRLIDIVLAYEVKVSEAGIRYERRGSSGIL